MCVVYSGIFLIKKNILNTQQGILHVRCHISQKTQSSGMPVCCASVLAYETNIFKLIPSCGIFEII